MNLTPKEAAEKYRSLEYRGLGQWYTPDGECLDEEEVASLRHTLAEAYLEQNPADDEEAITREFVASLHDGFEFSPFATGESWYADLDGELLITVFDDGAVSLNGERLPKRYATRRQLRDLLKVLGIKN